MTQFRQWLGLVIAFCAVLGLVQAGRALGRIEEKVDSNAAEGVEIREEFVAHVRDADKGFRDVAKLVADLDARVSKQEGRQEERDRRGD